MSGLAVLNVSSAINWWKRNSNIGGKKNLRVIVDDNGKMTRYATIRLFYKIFVVFSCSCSCSVYIAIYYFWNIFWKRLWVETTRFVTCGLHTWRELVICNFRMWFYTIRKLCPLKTDFTVPNFITNGEKIKKVKRRVISISQVISITTRLSMSNSIAFFP